MNITRIVARRWIGAMANDPRAACHRICCGCAIDRPDRR